MVEGGLDAGLPVCRSVSPALSCFACRFRRFGAGWQRMAAHERGDRHNRTDPLDRPAQSTTSFARLVAEMALLTSRPDGRRRGGVSVSHATRGGGQGAFWGSTRSGSDPQFHQPLELADFLTKATQPGAVSCFQPHGGGEVAVPGGPVPMLVLGQRACLGARPGDRRLAGGDHLGFEFGQPRPAVDDFRYQHLAV